RHLFRIPKSELLWYPAAPLPAPVSSHTTEDLNEKTTLYRCGMCISSNACCSFGAEAGSTTELQSGKMLRNRESRQKRLRINRQQFLRRDIQGRSRSERRDPRAGRLLRSHCGCQQDSQIGSWRQIPVATMTPIFRIPGTAGIGLRLAHLAEVVATRPSTGWFEIHPENFLANPHA